MFGPTGVLPHDVEATLEQIEESFLVTGVGLRLDGWDEHQRSFLLQNLTIVVNKFRQAGGVREIFINGSFVEDKLSPSDIDGYFVLDSRRDWAAGTFQRRLEVLDEPGIWTWDPDHRVRCQSAERKPPFWCRYRVELYPDLGLRSDIIGPNGDFLLYPEAFRQRTSTMEPKGIIRLQF